MSSEYALLPAAFGAGGRWVFLCVFSLFKIAKGGGAKNVIYALDNCHFCNFSIPNIGIVEAAEPLDKGHGVLNPNFHHSFPKRSAASYVSPSKPGRIQLENGNNTTYP